MPVSYSNRATAADVRRGGDLGQSETRHARAYKVKRAIDVLGACFALIVLCPLLLVIAALVKLQDGGPVLHRRRVVGPDGPFDAFKFRSMCPDADSILENSPELKRAFEGSFKLQQDPRVTPLGLWLRRLSLDELPQFWNVVLGQMSLVGPRMITAPELVKYGENQALLLTVKPGLTGYWQVHGRQEVSYEERVVMDIQYIRTWSLSKDLQLLALTPMRVLRGMGAY
jgi:lipopolysaccharide/colanic/teichoic acid biosynthesis glycosyltransferase